MTPDEMRQEMCNQTGDSDVLRRRRQLQCDPAQTNLEPAVVGAQLAPNGKPPI